ncbi:MAG TPA: LysR family transcriptional regulator [Gammaproteobacteria bacterium]|nr:LysR family transcriptional regulator [Gammaproteobacteria bacterium]
MAKDPYETLDLKALRCFFFVAKRGSVTRAAHDLGIAGPAVTQRVKQLEADLGVKLYETRGGRVRLTPAGERTRAFAVSLFEQIDDFEQALALGEERGQIVLASHDTYLGYLLPPTIRRFKLAHPHAQLKLLGRPIDEILRLLKDNEIDLGIIPARKLPPDLYLYPIGTHEAVMLLPKGHPLARRAQTDFSSIVNAETVRQYPLIVAEVQRDGGVLEDTFARLGLPLEVAIEVDSLDAMKRYAAHGLGIAFLPAFCVSEADHLQLEIVPVPPELGAQTEYGVVVRRDKHRSPLLKHLLEMLGAVPPRSQMPPK